jgi:tetratricopeptide (TPR) repeat protein
MPFPTHDPFSGSNKAAFRRRRRKTHKSPTIPEIARQKIFPWFILIFVVIVTIMGVVAGWENIYQPNEFAINSITTPKSLDELGLSSTVISQRLSEKIQDVIRAARFQLQAPPEAMPDITIPGTGMSAQKLVAWINSFLPERWHRVITGEVVADNKFGTSYTLTLRLNGKPLKQQPLNSNDLRISLDRATQNLSEEILDNTDLYLAATAFILHKNPDKAEDRVDEILSTYPANSEQIRDAWNLKGYLAEQRSSIESARIYYRMANTSVSLDNLAGIILRACVRYPSSCDQDEILLLYRDAVKLKPWSSYAHFALGNYLYYVGNEQCTEKTRKALYAEAGREFETARNLDNTNGEAFAGLGSVDYLKRDSAWRYVSLGYMAAAIRLQARDNDPSEDLALLRNVERDPKSAGTYATNIDETNMFNEAAQRADRCARQNDVGQLVESMVVSPPHYTDELEVMAMPF